MLCVRLAVQRGRALAHERGLAVALFNATRADAQRALCWPSHGEAMLGDAHLSACFEVTLGC